MQIRRSFHKPIYKSFIAKSDAQRWSRETERLIEVGEFLDTIEVNKTTLRKLLQRYERECQQKKELKKGDIDYGKIKSKNSET